ncbi:hypothetical protein CF335_g8914 [Tilletia laevis]|nr:hypothetical protein CF335_g8914 [Tilletia laevis]
MEAAALVAIALSNSGGRAPDWPDFLGIVLLLLANATVGFVEERQAGRPSLLSRTGSPSTGKPSSSSPSSPRTRSSCSAYASRTENADAIDSCVVGTLNSPAEARAGIRVVDFQPFDPSTKRTQVTYVETETNKMYRVNKGMSPIILNLCTLNKTEEISRRLEADVEEFAMRGLRAHQRRPLQASPKAPSKHLVTTASPRVPSKSSRIKSSMPRATPKTRTTRTGLGVDQALLTIVTVTGPSSTCGSTTYLPLPLSSLGQPPSGTPSLRTARVAKGWRRHVRNSATLLAERSPNCILPWPRIQSSAKGGLVRSLRPRSFGGWAADDSANDDTTDPTAPNMILILLQSSPPAREAQIRQGAGH